MSEPAPNTPSTPTTDPATTNGGEPATQTPPATGTPGEQVDLAKLPADQLSKVLENPELFKQPRIAELLDAKKQLDKLQKEQADAADKKLADEKNFEELVNKKTKENEELQAKLQKFAVDQTLTNKLIEAGVVDLDGALKLVDRSKITVDENGVSGADDAFEALKTEKAYLFTGKPPTSVGTPTNPSNEGESSGGPSKFKSSQITAEFYQAHKAEVDEAYAKGLIEDDGNPPQ